ncbi:RusA family crossover junction endodeoxyribonuclease [Levilactobacillus brevis]|uniref:RusA family crossover junction endodeoxyribonuclease n=1 Tax=Levilactobacillus brevis TaxID=1580 RepID=UPI0015CB1AE1|nr:RusA family crossover junction endodeoxyribonuclease [Levilactobacillus brevis]
MIELVVYGVPVEAARPKLSYKTRHAYDPEKSRAYKQYVSLEVSKQYHGDLIDEKPLSVHIAIYRPIQTSVSNIEHARRAQNVHRPIVKPDTSNYVKLIEDALTGVIWKDDNCIVDLTASKYYSDNPRIEVTVTEA